eukprot:NODE_27174_length_522_cov_4.549367.p2 GENE.NODE_27174_length_522_cov_4.549367~~NODE_27174_length_522_cov_4.549367.p2  ORF type:complete len:94 (+),score=12.78 NODE_27174_length_522_cov_4.549367:238-519(+)
MCLTELDKLSRPVGQRLDMARAALGRAVAKAGRASFTLNKATGNLDEAKLEVTAAYMTSQTSPRARRRPHEGSTGRCSGWLARQHTGTPCTLR